MVKSMKEPIKIKQRKLHVLYIRLCTIPEAKREVKIAIYSLECTCFDFNFSVKLILVMLVLTQTYDDASPS